MGKSLFEVISEAINEATLLELGCTTFDTKHMLLTATRLAGVPYLFVSKVFHQMEKKAG